LEFELDGLCRRESTGERKEETGERKTSQPLIKRALRDCSPTTEARRRHEDVEGLKETDWRSVNLRHPSVCTGFDTTVIDTTDDTEVTFFTPGVVPLFWRSEDESSGVGGIWKWDWMEEEMGIGNGEVG
jgi:hypothetical protein